ncbi:MAG: phosphatase PAP2 family protein [Burkholderiaceae bacterium]
MSLSLFLGVALWRCETKETAHAFIRPLLGCLIVMLGLKLFFLSCGDSLILNIASPSGHTAASTFVFGSIGLVMSTHAPKSGRIPILAAMALLIASIAISRVYLGAHSIAEVIVALFVGVCAVSLFAIPYNRMSHPPVNFWKLATAFVAVMVLMYGIEAPTEFLIRKWAGVIRTKTNACTVGKISVTDNANGRYLG